LSRKRTSKIVIEYQTIEPVEYRLKRKYLHLFIDFFHGDAIRKYSDAIVGVTEEITRYQLNRSGITNKPQITIGNGFDVASVPERDARQYDNTELHLLCVANVSKWHGLDRLLKGMAEYRGNTRIIFHIAGGGDEILPLRQLVEKLNIRNQVIFHGFKTGKELDSLFNTCHIAVGSLGIHRKGLTQTSELKAREYCARGIPYIIACADPDFPDDFPYIHRVSPDDSQIDIEKIIEFAQMVCTDPDHPKKMRAYALEHLDWSVKTIMLKGFLETLVGEPESIV
jgi:glycosyltransferase involved in cell wall biosynthesis